MELIYLSLPSMEMSKWRVAERVAHGGHNIPSADIERRFSRSLSNLLNLFSSQTNACRCFMNTGPTPKLVFHQEGELRKLEHLGHFQELLDKATS
jgi:predicted ABC-type ATPase